MSYAVHAEWDETGWWVVTVPDVPGAITQVKRLSQVREGAAEVIEIQTGAPVDPAAFKIDWFIHGTAGETAAKARVMRGELDQVTRSAVRELRKSGFSLRDTGELTGISFQRAAQIDKELREG